MILILALFAAGCAKPAPPIAVDSYCEKFVQKDLTDKGLRAQSDANLRADLANANTHTRDCIGDRSGSGGPR